MPNFDSCSTRRHGSCDLPPNRDLRIIAAAVALLVTTIGCSPGGGMFAPSERLTPAVHALMDSLMVDEWTAEARYDQVLQEFGNVSPFKQLRVTNGKRLTALERAYLHFGTLPPLNPYRPTKQGLVSPSVEAAATFESRETACELSVTLELETVGRYQRLLALAPPRAVAKVAEDNRSLSLDADIPAAQHCR